ncbi:hypothetical protein JTE90_009863 [Oedothorax gibbosus]|uniref:Secreted protein n=1 Tax=Oedothorax gibbosus TaxID=931172 RepID=A0AAV6TVM3_9ARAC|nr:hypothetical protein JTE90_009863 [Oedothorax gibbosus]
MTISISSAFSVLALLYSIRHLYFPSSAFLTPSMVRRGGDPVTSKYALELTLGEGKCRASDSIVARTSKLYTGLPEPSLCQRTSVTSSSVVVVLRSHGSSTRPPSRTE